MMTNETYFASISESSLAAGNPCEAAYYDKDQLFVCYRWVRLEEWMYLDKKVVFSCSGIEKPEDAVYHETVYPAGLGKFLQFINK